MGDRYHRGELRDELVRVALDLIAEQGVAGFSVAEVARRAQVSPGAPYRHFAERESLLAAVATAVASQLADRVAAAAEPMSDPADALAAAAGAYTEYVIERRAGMNVIYTDGLQGGAYTELHDQTRRLTDQFLMLCLAVSDRPEDALELMEQLFTQAHGYGMFWIDGVFTKHGYTPELVVRKSVAAARLAIEGHRHRSGTA
ncbi:TetR/AcrR family transcriptional regulator [Prauserella rugosa]|uniref:TetR family transcriptional regulator n=1 Tax=Prauserella rugosa TaxID=43354 RepID=A0A660CGD1_9PSEU|nr:TetR/AcrR family transcriptional regulator [Prauserella rugosa]KID30847.1 transcriptional regulator, TetR family [Prauserella sp. Am3]KMS82243.1 TetR family transcriptional regulator [Streptomyces regensis]TWH22618.1 TetR family transcriptional regulator [Prauserella rugosa]